MTDINNVFDAVARERAYQDDKYGGILYRDLSIGDYLVILRQELREAEHAFVKEPRAALLLEVLQVAAVAVACLERHGVVERRTATASAIEERAEYSEIIDQSVKAWNRGEL